MAKYKHNVILEVTVGLPGSGKTTVAKELERKYGSKTKRVDLDATFELSDWRRADKYGKDRILQNSLLNHMTYSCPDRFIVDGLFLTSEDVQRLILATHKLFGKIKVVIHQWNEDRETCIKNDGGRREESSTSTILNAEFDSNIDCSALMNKLKENNCENVETITIQYHKVELKPDWERYFRGKIYVWEDGKFRSERWCTGGSYGSYLDDKLSPVSPDPQPDFEELENLLTEICPNVTFLQYKKIMRDCVTIAEEYDRDYYGGGCSYSRYVCDTKKLYECLEQFGYAVNYRPLNF